MPQPVWRDDLDRTTLARVIDALPMHLRPVARLRFQMRWSRSAIATELGLNETTVMGRVDRAHVAIDRLLASGDAVPRAHVHLVQRARLHFAGLT